MINNIIIYIRYLLFRIKQFIHSMRTHTYFDASPRNMEALMYMLSVVNNENIKPQTPYQHWTEQRLQDIYNDLCNRYDTFKDQYPTYDSSRKYIAHAAVEKIMQYAPLDPKK